MWRTLKEELAKKISSSAGFEYNEVLNLLEEPKDEKLADIALPCFGLAKIFKKSPSDIAKELETKIDLKGTLFERVSATGPYLNFFFSYPELAEVVLKKIQDEKENYGSGKEGEGKLVIIDYSSPNIAKPFHLGHLRSTVIGGALVRIFRFLGYKVIGINHLGDWGTQFGMVLAGYEEMGNEKELEKDPIRYLLGLYVEYNQRAEQDESARARAREWFRRLEASDERARKLWEKFRDLSVEEFKRIYKRLGIEFDYYWGESFYNDQLGEVLALLKERGLLEKGEDNAELVRLDDEGLPPLLLRKSDGATLYATRELASAIYRAKKFRFERMLYVVGTPQELHFKQVISVLKKLGFEFAERMVHIKFGHIHGLSTRKGEIVLLEEVLEEAIACAKEKIVENIKEGKLEEVEDIDSLAEVIGISALIINDLKNRREREIALDWERMLNFEGETGPYLQYTHAKICGIKRKAQKEPSLDVNYSLMNELETRIILKKLAQFEEVVRNSALEYEPFLITNYLFELASSFNLFYSKHRVIGSAEYEPARLLLVDSVRQVLSNGVSLLGLNPLSKM